MSGSSKITTILVFVGIAAVALVLLKARLSSLGNSAKALESKFKRKALLTSNELEFLSRLESAAPELRFHAQVAMGALLDPAVSRKDGKEFFRLRGMFAQKIVDFVAQSRHDGSVVAIIELDDRTHDGEKDAKRDAMLASAGYRIIRWHSKSKPDATAIRAELLPAPPPSKSPTPSAAKPSA